MARDQDYTGQRALRPGETILSSAPNADTIAAAESRGYARGIEAAAKACDGKWGNYGTRMAMDIRALLPAPSEG